jgi:TonB-dependent starch-binding outer membrane protein SusC
MKKILNLINVSHLRQWMLIIPLVLSGFVLFAQARISGKIIDENGESLTGVAVLEKGTANGTATDINGNYAISVRNGSILAISYTGYTPQEITVGSESIINVSMVPNANTLGELVVTGYTTQRKRDISGAVSVVKSEDLKSQTGASFSQRLEGRATGVVTSTSGQPGEGTNIRIRGFSSFATSNDPLIVVDGVQFQDKFNNMINPNDIESIQILKDASAANIYGVRANNGVIIITTKKGKAGKTKISYDANYGIQNPVGGYNDFLVQSTADDAKVLFKVYKNAGLAVDVNNPFGTGAEPVIPTYIYPTGSNTVDESKYNYPNNLIMKTNQVGTDWWDEVYDPAPMTEHNLNVSGGTDRATFSISGNYFNQQGTMKFTHFKRYSIRANSEFTAGRWKFGENFTYSRGNQVSQPGGNQAEGNVMTNIIKAHPSVPVYDISGVNFAGSKANGLGNGSNPYAMVYRNRKNDGDLNRILGNVYTVWNPISDLKLRSSYGVTAFSNWFHGFSYPTFENSEPNTVNGFNETWQNGFDWIWTNTATYDHTFNEKHHLNLLGGVEALRRTYRQVFGQFNGYFNTEEDNWYLNGGLADPGTDNVSSFGNFGAIFSMFGQVDYNFNEKYYLRASVRRDGSSSFGDDKYGVFPAASIAWRLSEEPFLKSIEAIDELKIRAGFGITGFDEIPAGNAFDRYSGGPESSFYDINGSNGSAVLGYALNNRGSAATTWEENRSTNLGLDLNMYKGKFGLVLDLWTRTVDGLLVNPTLPGTAGTAAPAFINAGKVSNRGVDLGLNHRNRIGGGLGYDVSLNLSHYKNKLETIVGDQDFFLTGGFDSRIGTVGINKVGQPIGTFFGWTVDGIWQNQAEIDEQNRKVREATGNATAVYQASAVVGGLRWKDIDGEVDGVKTGASDGKIDAADQGVIGSPHPDLTMGLNLGLNYKGFDLTAFIFGSYGNQIFNYNKLFTDFRQFNTNVRTEVLNNSWAENKASNIPQLNINDAGSRTPSTYYIEDGSYTRLRTLQIGYALPKSLFNGKVEKIRVYVQGQNIFTATKYSGIDPALSTVNVQNSNGVSNNNLLNGFDFGNYPTSKIFLVGINANF